MPILVDLNQIVINGLFDKLGPHLNVEIDHQALRLMVLNLLHSSYKKFHREYGEMIIAIDSQKNWRKSKFPFYKSQRKKKKEISELNWEQFYQNLDKIKEELRDSFPFKYIEVDLAEADDIIGVICWSSTDKIVILSKDKDFRQLQVLKYVEQYDPVGKKWIKEKDPITFLNKQIIKGDESDGIPNILSRDNSFLTLDENEHHLSRRQLKDFLDTQIINDAKYKKNYFRNRTLIDLREVPELIKQEIIHKYREPVENIKERLNEYYKNNNLDEFLNEVYDL
jgi:5'-3' exonuclease